MSQQPISIIGAGIGGLTLGRCLSKRGIPAVLYERAASSPRHSYGITLHASAYKPLLKVLGMDEQTFKSRIAVDGHVGGQGAIDTRKLAHHGSIGPGSFRANRGKLETLLREGLDIKWEHGLDKIDDTSNGLSFSLESGHWAEQACVVGADGVHTSTRNSLMPKSELDILPYVAFNGKRRVDRSTFDKLYAPTLGDSTIVEVRKNNAVLQVSVNDNTEDVVSISWIYSRAARGSSDSLFQPNRPLSSATDTPEEFYQEIAGLKDLDQPFKDIFDQDKLKKERILSWLMRTMEVGLTELRELGKKGILFIGDSVHAQPILGGEGANAAMKDAIELADQLSEDGINSIAEWYEARFPGWKEGVERSKATIERIHTDRTSVL